MEIQTRKTVEAARKILLREISKSAGGLGAAASAATVLDGLPAVAFVGGLAGAIGALARGNGNAAPWLALALGAALVRGTLAWCATTLGARASVRARDAMRRRVVAACLDPSGGAPPPVGEIMVAAIDGTEALDGYAARFLPARAAAAISPLLVLAAVAVASPTAAAILAATLVPFIMLMILAGGAAAGRARAQFTALSKLGGLFADRVRHLPTIIAYGAEEAETARLGRAADALRRRTIDVLRVAIVSSSGLDFFAAICVALVAVYTGLDLMRLLPGWVSERLDLGHAFFVLALAPEFYAPMRRLAACYHDRRVAEAAADGLALLTRRAPRPAVPLPALAHAPAIHFAAVTVRYPGEDAPALHELEFTAPAGQITAIVGPSGSGKTSALRLLLGLAPLAGGEVWIGDAALSEVGGIAPWVAWVGQAPLVVPGTIAENLSLARLDATRAELEAASKTVGLCAALRARAGGLDSTLDERGGGLSGGERRRLALARAILKQPPILLLDEPTAHLDAAAEADMIAIIRAAARGRTTIIATHSRALARAADHVVELEAP